MQTIHFTVALWCVFVAALLPIGCAGVAKAGMFGKPRREGGYDNENPRVWLARQKDWRARANAAQANSFEALPFFMAAVIIDLHHDKRALADSILAEGDASALPSTEDLVALIRGA